MDKKEKPILNKSLWWKELEEQVSKIHWEEWERPVIVDGVIMPACLAPDWKKKCKK